MIGVLLILAVVPQLDVQEFDKSPETALAFIHKWSVSCSTSADSVHCELKQGEALTDFLESFDNCLYLENYGDIMKDDVETRAERRMTVMTKYSSGSEDDNSMLVAIFDDQAMETEVRLMNILLTLFVVVIFSAGSWIFNNDAKKMIIEPIERLTLLVKKLAGMVFMLSAEEEGDELGEENEMDFIDLIANKMSNVFDKDEKLNKKANKTASKLIPSEVSPAGSRGSRRISPQEEDESSDPLDLVHSRPELINLRSCLHDPKARSYFRLFLSREFNVENIAFWEAVYDYKLLFVKRARFIYTTYISQAAVSQVNIPAIQRAKIKGVLTTNVGECSADMFDLAHGEIFKLMERDPFPRFLKSDLAVSSPWHLHCLLQGQSQLRLPCRLRVKLPRTQPR